MQSHGTYYSVAHASIYSYSSIGEPRSLLPVRLSCPPHHASIMIIKSFRCRYQWMPRDASSEPDSARSPLSLRGSWGLEAAGLLLVVSGCRARAWRC